MSDNEHWLLVQQAFEEVVALAGTARAERLARFEADHPELAGQLLGLVAADSRTSNSVSQLVASSISDYTEPKRWLDAQIGAWSIKESIGAGGMGEVFLAHRTAAFDQIAALKIMGAQLVHADAQRRFAAERQILARLQHPYIATLIDGGTSEQGVPYLVMEYVRGETLYEYCDARHLDVDARLQLFRKICEAVDYAHRNLVVHRDLKPGNILIDEDGNPKLLDFGIAKIIEPDDGPAEAPRTEFQARVMTPQYASPEQVRGEPVTVATDTYALGVLLFHLLTGASPYHPSSPNPRDIEHSVLEETPKRPSVAVSDVTRTLPDAQVSTQRRSTPVKLSRKLAGDLDNIALTCLQKDPARRYSSVDALNQDLGRYLRNEPVYAHADSLLYRTRKFVLRNTVPVAMAALAGVIIVGMSLFYTQRLAAERDQARLAADEANAVSDFLGNLFASASPQVAQGQEIKAIDLLHIATEDIGELTEQPRLQSRLLHVMGGSYAFLGDLKKSQALLTESVELMAQDPDLEPRVFAEALGTLAETQSLLEEVAPAEANALKALAILEQAYGQESSEIVRTLGVLSRVYSRVYREEDSRPVLERALRIVQAENKPVDNRELLLTAGLMDVLGELDLNAEAMEMGRAVQQQSDAVVGPLHPDSVIRRGNLAVQAVMSGHYQEALDLAATMHSQATTIWDRRKPQFALSTVIYARTLMHMGQFEESEAQLRDALARVEEFELSESLMYAHVQLGRSVLFLTAGRPDAAKAILEPLLPTLEQRYGATFSVVLGARQLLSDVRLATGDVVGALELANGLLPLLESARFPVQRATYVTLIKAHTAMQAPRRADEYVTMLAESFERAGLADSVAALDGWEAISAYYQERGQPERALDVAQRAASIAQQLPTGHWLRERAQASLTALQNARG